MKLSDLVSNDEDGSFGWQYIVLEIVMQQNGESEELRVRYWTYTPWLQVHIKPGVWGSSMLVHACCICSFHGSKNAKQERYETFTYETFTYKNWFMWSYTHVQYNQSTVLKIIVTEPTKHGMKEYWMFCLCLKKNRKSVLQLAAVGLRFARWVHLWDIRTNKRFLFVVWMDTGAAHMKPTLMAVNC